MKRSTKIAGCVFLALALADVLLLTGLLASRLVSARS